jgi:hypothetical protein
MPAAYALERSNLVPEGISPDRKFNGSFNMRHFDISP